LYTIVHYYSLNIKVITLKFIFSDYSQTIAIMNNMNNIYIFVAELKLSISLSLNFKYISISF